jgi:hypothetical protein
MDRHLRASDIFRIEGQAAGFWVQEYGRKAETGCGPGSLSNEQKPAFRVAVDEEHSQD